MAVALTAQSVSTQKRGVTITCKSFNLQILLYEPAVRCTVQVVLSTVHHLGTPDVAGLDLERDVLP